MFELIAERNRLMEENRQLRKKIDTLEDECVRHTMFILKLCEVAEARKIMIDICQRDSGVTLETIDT